MQTCGWPSIPPQLKKHDLLLFLTYSIVFSIYVGLHWLAKFLNMIQSFYLFMLILHNLHPAIHIHTYSRVPERVMPWAHIRGRNFTYSSEVGASAWMVDSPHRHTMGTCSSAWCMVATTGFHRVLFWHFLVFNLITFSHICILAASFMTGRTCTVKNSAWLIQFSCRYIVFTFPHISHASEKR